MSVKRRSVLIVDDEESICLLYQAELEDRGYDARVQSEPTRVLEEMASHAPDLVVLDIKMPDVSGLDLLAQIKEHFPRVRVVLNSAYGSFKESPAVQQAEAYVVKSSDLSELLDTIETLLP